MRTTFAAPLTTASQVQCKPGSIIELMATLGTVFMRTRFGEHYLRPVSLWKGSLAIAAGLGLVRFMETRSASAPGAFEASSGSFLTVMAATGLAIYSGRFLFAAAIFFIGISPCLALRSPWPWFADPMRSNLETISWTFFAFAIVFMGVAGNHITLSVEHAAPLALSCGRSSSLWMRVPSAYRPWRTEWDVQRYAEPLLVAMIGIVLLGVFSNWFGSFLLLVALCISTSATMRFREATSRVASASSGGEAADAFADELESAHDRTRSANPGNEPFDARSRHRG